MRRIIAGAFLFVGLFVFCFGVGNGPRQTVMVAGLAIIVLAFSARIATNFRRSPRQWIRGTGHVVEASEPPAESRYGRCAMQLVVDVAGLPTETVLVHDSRVPVAQWPRPGDELPIQVAADDVRNVRVLWRDQLAAGNGERPEFAAELVVEVPVEPAWDDDQPAPAPAAPPGSHLDLPAHGDIPEPAVPVEPPADVDFDIDSPPTAPLGPLPPSPFPAAAAAPAAASTADEGQVDRDVPLAGERRVPSPRPRPRTPRQPVPAAAAATTSATLDPVDSDLVTSYPSAHPGQSGAINGVGVTVLVSDLARSVEFYRDKLGFYEVDGGDDNVVLASGETRLVLRQAADLGAVKHRLVHLNLEVADVDAMYQELKARGVRFTYPPRPANRSARLELWAAAFRDPDGHGIALTQWRPAG